MPWTYCGEKRLFLSTGNPITVGESDSARLLAVLLHSSPRHYAHIITCNLQQVIYHSGITAKMACAGSSAAKTVKTAAFQISVLRCRKTGRVLFLEAGKDFVDTLFSFLLLPVGSIIHMLASAGVQVKEMGGIASLLESMEKLDSSFVHVDKKHILQPRPAVAGTCGSIGLLLGLEAAEQKSFNFELPALYYRCNSNSCTNLSSTAGTACTACLKTYRNSYVFNQPFSVLPEDLQILKQKILEGPAEKHPHVEEGACTPGQGFVRDNITYMVTDQLEIMPSTTIRSIKVLNKLKIATLSDLESSDIDVNITQVLQLLQSAMTSSSCLNDVFGKK